MHRHRLKASQTLNTIVEYRLKYHKANKQLNYLLSKLHTAILDTCMVLPYSVCECVLY